MQLCLLPPPICEHQFQFHFQNGPFTRRALFFSSLIWDPRRAIRCTVCTCHRVEARRGRVRQGKAGRGSAGRKREGARAAAVDAAPCEHRQPRQPSQPASQPTDTDSEKHTHTHTRRDTQPQPQPATATAQRTANVAITDTLLVSTRSHHPPTQIYRYLGDTTIQLVPLFHLALPTFSSFFSCFSLFFRPKVVLVPALQQTRLYITITASNIPA